MASFTQDKVAPSIVIESTNIQGVTSAYSALERESGKALMNCMWRICDHKMYESEERL